MAHVAETEYLAERIFTAGYAEDVRSDKTWAQSAFAAAEAFIALRAARKGR